MARARHGEEDTRNFRMEPIIVPGVVGLLTRREGS